MTDRVYEKYAWVLLFAAGTLSLLVGLAIMVVPEPLDATGVKNLTGMTWQEIRSTSPAAASLVSYFVRQFGIASSGLGILLMGLAWLGIRRGQKWAWSLSWIFPLALFGYIVTNLQVGGTFWEVALIPFILALLGLVLPYKRFFPKTRPG